MKLKLDENGNAVLQDGKPVYVKDDGTEQTYDIVSTTQTISRLQGEAQGHRERYETTKGELDQLKKKYEGIEDPDAAREAISTVANLDDKKLVDAGEVQKVKDETKRAVEEHYAPVVQERDDLKVQLKKVSIDNAFANSKFIQENVAAPLDMVMSVFSKNFDILDGNIIAKDENGQEIYSTAKPGEKASFEEAIEMIVNAYPHKDQILKSSGASGGGSKPSDSHKTGGSKGDFGGDHAERVAAVGNKFPDLPKG